MTGLKSFSEAIEGRPGNDKPEGGAAPATRNANDDRDRRRRHARLAGLLAMIVGFTGAVFVDFGRFREPIFDFYQRLAPAERAIDYVQIVEIDEASLNQFGAWPWPRDRLAELAERIAERGALAIGFDMLFVNPDHHGPRRFLETQPGLPVAVREQIAALPDPDRRFAAAIGRLPVVLGRAGVTRREGRAAANPGGLYTAAEFPDPEPSGLLAFDGVLANIADLDEVAAGHAALNGPPDVDGVVRGVPLVVKIGDSMTPTLGLEMLRVAAGEPAIGLKLIDDELAEVSIGGTSVPVDRMGRLRPRFSVPGSTPTVSAAAVLSDDLAPDAFAGTVVLVGLASVGLKDVVATPTAAAVYATEVHAQVIHAILSGQWLRRADWLVPAELAGAVLGGLLAISLLPGLRARQAIAAAVLGIGLLVGASAAGFAIGGLLIDFIPPTLISGIAVLAVLGTVTIETDRHRRRLRVALQEERVRASRIAGELEAAREIQLGMLPSAAALAGLPASVDMHAILQPARAVGGDLFDAFMLDDRRLYFMVGDVTGKGVPASLFMALTKALKKSVMLRHAGDLADSVALVNAEISRENVAELFVTALIGVLDLETGVAELCNAGHENPILLKASGAVREITMDGGPPLCAFEGFPYPIEPLTLAPGDMLVVLTDGVTEAFDPAGSLLGRATVIDLLERVSRPLDAAGVVSALTRAVRDFEAGAEPTDDLTVMAVRYLGNR